MGAEPIIPVCKVESFFHAIPMMNININVQDSRVVLQQLQNSQHQVIDITKACTAARPVVVFVSHLTGISVEF